MLNSIIGGFDFLGGGILSYVVPFLFVLTIIVFFHELGHFLVARWHGVKVLSFSIGFGPELFGFNDRHGTRWKLSAIPLGGYVKFFGDENEASAPDAAKLGQMDATERNVSFHHQPVAARAAIVAAGPIANFILAIVIFAGVFMFFGKQHISARVETIQPNSAAAAAGFMQGDLVLEIDGSKIEDFAGMQRIVAVSAGIPLKILVDRQGKEVTLTATPALREVKDALGNVQRIGLLGIGRPVGPDEAKRQQLSPLKAIVSGAEETWYVVTQTLGYLRDVVIGRKSADQIGGPLMIAKVSGQAANLGFVALINFAAVLSVSIGLLNLFPIPLLDGGHLLFYAIESLRGRPLSERAQEIGFRIGLGLVLMLMVFATRNDLCGLFLSGMGVCGG